MTSVPAALPDCKSSDFITQHMYVDITARIIWLVYVGVAPPHPHPHPLARVLTMVLQGQRQRHWPWQQDLHRSKRTAGAV